jgi:hypothetical protein
MQVRAEADFLKTLPCAGRILSRVTLEIWRVERFPSGGASGPLRWLSGSGAFQRRSYQKGRSADITPSIGRAFMEAGNLVVIKSARGSALLYKGEAQEESPESRRGSSSAFSRCLSGIERARSLSSNAAEADGPSSSSSSRLFGRPTVKRGTGLALSRLKIDCDTRSPEWLLQP